MEICYYVARWCDLWSKFCPDTGRMGGERKWPGPGGRVWHIESDIRSHTNWGITFLHALTVMCSRSFAHSVQPSNMGGMNAAVCIVCVCVKLRRHVMCTRIQGAGQMCMLCYTSFKTTSRHRHLKRNYASVMDVEILILIMSKCKPYDNLHVAC